MVRTPPTENDFIDLSEKIKEFVKLFESNKNIKELKNIRNSLPAERKNDAYYGGRLMDILRDGILMDEIKRLANETEGTSEKMNVIYTELPNCESTTQTLSEITHILWDIQNDFNEIIGKSERVRNDPTGKAAEDVKNILDDIFESKKGMSRIQKLNKNAEKLKLERPSQDELKNAFMENQSNRKY